MGSHFNYAKEFTSLDYDALKQDIHTPKLGGQPIMAITVLSLSAWLGIQQAPTALVMGVAVEALARSVLHRSTARLDTATSGGGRFVEAVLQPTVTVTHPDQVDTAIKLHEKARYKCFIANSLNFGVKISPVVQAGDSRIH